MNIPSIIIVANRGHLVAYRKTDNGALEAIDADSFAEGTSKISEIVTDQSGAFPMTGGFGTGSYESLPLVNELEARSFRKVADKIGAVLDSHTPSWWGFASPSEINGAITDHLDERHRSKISINLKLDLTNSPKDDVYRRFEKAASEGQPA